MTGKRVALFDQVSPTVFAGAVVVALLVGFAIYSSVRLVDITYRANALTLDLASTTALLIETNERVAQLENATQGFGKSLSAAEQKLAATASNVDAVKSQVGGVEATVGNISGTVTILQKLSKTDPELLIKYSKTYFLNENFTPLRLAHISGEYLYKEDQPEQLHADVWRYLQSLMDSAKSQNIQLYVKSAYRSFDAQESLKSAYRVTYGAGTANQFSADQGYSEHQLGTTVDFITKGLNGQLEGFGDTTAYQWLTANAYKYGFVLSYPKDNAYYVFEPWHWRFVGVALATYLHNQGKQFYNLDQRAIDEYLAGIFD